jgi:hypothetical protein
MGFTSKTNGVWSRVEGLGCDPGSDAHNRLSYPPEFEV